MDVIDVATDSSENSVRSGESLESPIEVESSFLPNSALQLPAAMPWNTFSGKRPIEDAYAPFDFKKTKLEHPLINAPGVMKSYVDGRVVGSFEKTKNSMVKGKESLEQVKDSISHISTQTNEEMHVPMNTMTVSLMLHQRLSLCWMVKQEQGGIVQGGMLADDQGLGKMITSLALIVTNRPPDDYTIMPSMNCLEDEILEMNQVSMCRRWMETVMERTPEGKKPNGGTLVICPAVVLQQWETEIKEKLTPQANISVVRHHGKNRIREARKLSQYSVVLTTYATLAKEAGKTDLENKVRQEDEEGSLDLSDSAQEDLSASQGLMRDESGPLFGIYWFRVILDEAQCIKNKRSFSSRAVAALTSINRWCLSGTPIQNSICDLFPLFRFLKYTPYDDFSSFRELVAKPISREANDGFDRLKGILKGVLMRRTKGCMINGQPIVQLPMKDSNLEMTVMSEKESELYKQIQGDIKKEFKRIMKTPSSENYISSLLMILKLRQASSHPWLLKKRSSQKKPTRAQVNQAGRIPKKFVDAMLQRLTWLPSVCPFCGDAPDSPITNTNCEHVFCHQCISLELNSVDGPEEQKVIQCPQCKNTLKFCHFFTKEVLKEAKGEVSNEESESDEEWVSSAKLDRLMEILEGIRDRAVDTSNVFEKSSSDRCVSDQQLAGVFSKIPVQPYFQPIESDDVDKVLVFSQWTRMLDLIEIPLKKAKFQFRRIDGKMNLQQREKAVFEFKTRKEIMVMLISLKSASLGINLSCANHVILMDLWWNPTVEEQAIDRAHRIGQTRNVSVTRLSVKDTVDEGILELQERKRGIVSNTFGGEGGNVHVSGRLTMEDIRFLFRYGKLT